MIIYTLTESNSQILKELSKTYVIKPLDVNNLVDAYQNTQTAGVLIDCHSTDCMTEQTKNIVQLFLNNNKDVILLNVDSELMSFLVGFGVDCENAVVQSYLGNQSIITCIDNHVALPQIGGGQQKQNTKTGKVEDVEIEPSSPPVKKTLRSNFIANNPVITANNISSTISTRPTTGLEKVQNFKLASTEVELPDQIQRTFYVKLSQKRRMDPDVPQEYNNELVFVVEMLASYRNPPYKYLTITTLGSGLNPTNGKGLYFNTPYSKGYWQDNINIKMYPISNEITQLSTEPKNINKETNYKVETTLKIDVDVSKNPALKPSYTVTNTYQTTILDFEITNRSTPQLAEWDFQMSMSKDDVANVFENQLFDEPHVRELPVLATQNLQPYCASVWYVDNTFNGRIQVRQTAYVKYMRAWTSYEPFQNIKNWKWFNYGPSQVTFVADFGLINP